MTGLLDARTAAFAVESPWTTAHTMLVCLALLALLLAALVGLHSNRWRAPFITAAGVVAWCALMFGALAMLNQEPMPTKSPCAVGHSCGKGNVRTERTDIPQLFKK